MANKKTSETKSAGTPVRKTTAKNATAKSTAKTAAKSTAKTAVKSTAKAAAKAAAPAKGRRVRRTLGILRDDP